MLGIMALPHTILPKTGVSLTRAGWWMADGFFREQKKALEKAANKSCAHFSSAAGLVLLPLTLQRVT